MARHHKPGLGTLPGESKAEEQEARIRDAAQFIIEKIFHRQRWTASLRDQLAAELTRIINREAARKPRRAQE